MAWNRSATPPHRAMPRRTCQPARFIHIGQTLADDAAWQPLRGPDPVGGHASFAAPLLLAVALLLPYGCNGFDSSRELELNELERYTLPPEFTLAGAAFIPELDLVAAWSWETPEIVTYADSMRRYDLPGNHLVIGAGACGPNDFVEYVTTDGSVVRMDSAGSLLERDRLPGQTTWSAAVRLNQDWYIAGLDGSDFIVVHQPDDGPPSEVLRWRPSADDPTPGGVLTRGRDGVLVTRRTRPFETIAITNHAVRTLMTPSLAFLAGDSLSSVRWISLQALELDESTIIQTLADLTGSRRLVMLLDRTGAVERWRVLDVPIGFFGVSAEKPEVFGAIRLLQTELIRYRWCRQC